MDFDRPATPYASAALLAEMHRLALTISDQACLHLVTSRTTPERRHSVDWYDVRSLLTTHEQSAATCDLHAQVLAYGFFRQLLARHPTEPGLVRLMGGATSTTSTTSTTRTNSAARPSAAGPHQPPHRAQAPL